MIAIKDFKHLESYTRIIEKQLIKDLWDMIYKPMFKILNLKAKNDKNILIDAIDNGLIFYSDGGFKARDKFSNEISKELIKIGAKYDKWEHSYKIDLQDIPKDVLQTLTESVARAQRKLNNLNDFLTDVELNLEQIVETLIFDKQVGAILTDAEGKVLKNINTIEFDVTDTQKTKMLDAVNKHFQMSEKEIENNYTTNIQVYTKKWLVERIPEMRQRIQQAILEGYREDQVQKMLEREYGIMQRKAKFLAQNETSIMLTQLKKAIYTDMGFTHFQWNTILDSRERKLHRELHGRVFRYDEPPVIDERTGQKGLPGETYNCRCGMTPISLDSPFFNQTDIDRYTNLKYRKIMANIPPTDNN